MKVEFLQCLSNQTANWFTKRNYLVMFNFCIKMTPISEVHQGHESFNDLSQPVIYPVSHPLWRSYLITYQSLLFDLKSTKTKILLLLSLCKQHCIVSIFSSSSQYPIKSQSFLTEAKSSKWITRFKNRPLLVTNYGWSIHILLYHFLFLGCNKTQVNVRHF